MRLWGRLLPLAVIAAALLPQAASGVRQATPLTGTVGPGFNILLADANGNRVTHLDPGAYTITVHDRSDLHNFHLNGPGVEKFTQIETPREDVWEVTFRDGVYNYQCDAHPTQMSGSFGVGSASPPPPPPPPPPPSPTGRAKLTGTVGPGARITLKAAAGAIVAGPAAITIKDLTTKDNFHLTGPGVNKKTRVAAKGTVVWKVTLLANRKYTYRSDAHASLKKTFVPRPTAA
jgi:hypothetical protein